MSDEDIKQTETETEDEQSVEVEVEQPEAENEAKEVPAEAETQTAQQPSEQPEPVEDEHEQYSKNVQKRIKKLTEKYRQEERDKEEAARIAQVLKDENEKLKAQIGSTQQAHLTEYGSRLENQLNITKQAIKDAHDRGDIDQMIEAQQALSKISIEQERYRLAKERQDRLQVQKPEEEGQRTTTEPAPQQQAPAPEPDKRAQAWAEKNEWFGQDEVMTYAAFGIHNKLVDDEGFDPTSDEYYAEIDKRIVAEFPHKFKSQKTRSNQVASADTSASRKPSGRRTVKLTPSEVSMAKRLNVPLEEYAKYVKR